MFIEKPRVPEELYKFFTYGMPLLLTDYQYHGYVNYFRKRGWNVLTTADRDAPWLSMTYYANWSKPETWELEEYKYADKRP
jgi:hypothetical protein